MPERRPPRRRFGQHFLEPAWVAKVIEVIAPAPGEWLIEIGPGRGALTMALAARGAHVAAVEIDRDLAHELRRVAPPGVDIWNADALTVDFWQLLPPRPGAPDAERPPPVRIAGNLPYNISSPILFRLYSLSDQGFPCQDATLMLQREVVDRITAAPGSGDYGPLAIFTRLHAEARRVLDLPPGAFRPAPRVRSAVVSLRFRPPDVALPDRATFERLVRGLFTRRRKTVLNALKPLVPLPAGQAAALLERAGIDAGRRPETLQVSELARLAAICASAGRRAVL